MSSLVSLLKVAEAKPSPLRRALNLRPTALSWFSMAARTVSLFLLHLAVRGHPDLPLFKLQLEPLTVYLRTFLYAVAREGQRTFGKTSRNL